MTDVAMKTLIVEDDTATRRGLEESIKDFGGEPHAVGTAKQAEAALKQFQPHLLIVDISLPDGDGLALLRAAREERPDLDAVVITGSSSIDHAIESFCAGASNPYIRANTWQAVRLLFSSLRRTRENPHDLDARLSSQQAVWLATQGLFRVPMGASHGISYLLGSIGGAPHGYTSCVTLPAVLRWNESVNGELQRELAEAIGEPGTSVADSLGELLDELSLPRTLKDIGIVAEMIPQIVKYALQSPIVATNPRPIKTEADVLEILKLAS